MNLKCKVFFLAICAITLPARSQPLWLDDGLVLFEDFERKVGAFESVPSFSSVSGMAGRLSNSRHTFRARCNSESFTVIYWFKGERQFSLHPTILETGPWNCDEFVASQYYGYESDRTKNQFQVVTGEACSDNRLFQTRQLDHGEFHFIGVSYSRSGVVVYMDGEVLSSESLQADQNLGKEIYTFKLGGSSPDREISGSFDNLRIYNRTLSVDEFDELYDYEVLPQPVVSLNLGSNRDEDISEIGEIDYNNISYVPDAAGIENSAALFDGKRSSIVLRNNSWGNRLNFSVSFWVRAHNPVGGDHSIIGNYLMSSGNGWSVVIDNNNLKSWYFGKSSSVWQSDSGNHVRGLRTQKWYQVISVFSGAGNAVYVDGVPVKKFDWANASASTSSSTEEIVIGKFSDWNSDRVLHTSMMLDDLKIYDEPLTSDQISLQYKKSLPYKRDADKDGLSDGLEIEIGSNLLNPDTDNDGLFDGLEYQIGSNPLARDSDADGYDDKFEYDAGSSPLDPLSAPEVLEVYRAIELSFFTVEGVGYILQKSSDLQDWEDADEPFTGEGGRMSFFKRAETQEPSFWRLVRQAAE